MTPWLVYRLVKFLALAAFAGGIGLSVARPRQEDRASAAFWLATPAWWVACVAGYLLLKATSRSLGDPFVLVGLFASLGGLAGALLCATQPTPNALVRALGPAGLGIATAAMVTRDAPPAVLAVASVVVAALAALPVIAWPLADGGADAQITARLRSWFLWVARFEGLSLVLMVVIAMPVRKLTGLSLDGHTGALGWGHGLLVFLYLQALFLAARGLGWSVRTAVVAFVASLVPFGTFAFEALLPRMEPSYRA